MAESDNTDDLTASLDDIFTALGDRSDALGDWLADIGRQIWNYPINWEWLGYVVLALIGCFFLLVLWMYLVLLWNFLRRLWGILSDLVEIAWLLIRRRMRRGG